MAFLEVTMLIVACDDCGALVDDADDGVVPTFTTREEAEQALPGLSAVLLDGQVLCWQCRMLEHPFRPGDTAGDDRCARCLVGAAVHDTTPLL